MSFLLGANGIYGTFDGCLCVFVYYYIDVEMLNIDITDKKTGKRLA